MGVKWLTVSRVEQNVCTVRKTLNSRAQWKDNKAEAVTNPNKDFYGHYDALSNSSVSAEIILQMTANESRKSGPDICAQHVQTAANQMMDTNFN